MDYEKKYKEALDWARRVMDGKIGFVLDEVLEKFPELKESEDERIRKEIIKYLQNSTAIINRRMCESWISWLEKQGEQNPTDKVEPKFKVGDWVVREYTKDIITINQIVDVKRIDDECFCYTLDDGTYFSGSWESSYHLWIIQDAKDGDVLATDNSVFIYAKVLCNKPYAYCGVDKFGVFKDNCLNNNWANSVDNIHPATKEQRNLLFQKMKEAGYEWDAEKKELKKIEDKPLVIDEGKSEMDYCFTKMMNGEKVSSAWNEEDERLCSCLIEEQEESLDNVKNDKYGHSEIISDLKEMYRERIDWLKSIKDRVKPQWKPEDIHLEALRCVINGNNLDAIALKELLEQLKKL